MFPIISVNLTLRLRECAIIVCVARKIILINACNFALNGPHCTFPRTSRWFIAAKDIVRTMIISAHCFRKCNYLITCWLMFIYIWRKQCVLLVVLHLFCYYHISERAFFPFRLINHCNRPVLAQLVIITYFK